MVVSLFNHAGGAGKTSATRDLGYVLAEEGLSVLLIDADPQANLTTWLGVWEEVGLERTLYPAVIGEAGERGLPEPLRVHGLSLIPSSLELARLELEMSAVPFGSMRLQKAVREVAGEYDLVLIDCPPSLGHLSTLGVVASERVVVPVLTRYKGLQGIRTVVRVIDEFREGSPELRIAMFLLTQFDARTNHDREAVEALRSELVGVAPIAGPLASRPSVYNNATLAGDPVSAFSPGSKADTEVRAAAGVLADALRARVRG